MFHPWLPIAVPWRHERKKAPLVTKREKRDGICSMISDTDSPVPFGGHQDSTQCMCAICMCFWVRMALFRTHLGRMGLTCPMVQKGHNKCRKRYANPYRSQSSSTTPTLSGKSNVFQIHFVQVKCTYGFTSRKTHWQNTVLYFYIINYIIRLL